MKETSALAKEVELVENQGSLEYISDLWSNFMKKTTMLLWSFAFSLRCLTLEE